MCVHCIVFHWNYALDKVCVAVYCIPLELQHWDNVVLQCILLPGLQHCDNCVCCAVYCNSTGITAWDSVCAVYCIPLELQHLDKCVFVPCIVFP